MREAQHPTQDREAVVDGLGRHALSELAGLEALDLLAADLVELQLAEGGVEVVLEHPSLGLTLGWLVVGLHVRTQELLGELFARGDDHLLLAVGAIQQRLP
jgi:hypothetical protein